jgi:hypothetical protein
VAALIETTDTDQVIRLRLLRVMHDLGVYVAQGRSRTLVHLREGS